MSDEPINGNEPIPAEIPPVGAGMDPQTLSDRDQTAADGDQTRADSDQTAADSDESASERDQLAADRDQVAADDDRAAALDHGYEEDANGYARSRRARSKSARDREAASRFRAQTALARDNAATGRDQVAAERDRAAHERDALATELDARLEQLDLEEGAAGPSASNGTDDVRRVRDRRRAGLGRDRAAVQRDAAARDRELAAADRAQAAADRAMAAEEVAAEGVDELTGTLLRRVGLRAMQREVDRTRRSGEHLVVAYVDVDGLKQTNDVGGHVAGDDLLTSVAGSIKDHLRSYDVICRFGGDEFVCSLAGQDAAGVSGRFDEIRTRLAGVSAGATISVGLAERGGNDTLEGLIARADAALIETRRHPEP